MAVSSLRELVWNLNRGNQKDSHAVAQENETVYSISTGRTIVSHYDFAAGHRGDCRIMVLIPQPDHSHNQQYFGFGRFTKRNLGGRQLAESGTDPSIILRYDGTGWSPVAAPGGVPWVDATTADRCGSGQDCGDLLAVMMASAMDGWAVGESRGGGVGSTILRFQGGKWKQDSVAVIDAEVVALAG